MNMRLPVFLALLFLGQLAQGQDYHPMLREGVYWDVADASGVPICTYESARRYFFEGDTLINGTVYRKCYFHYLQSINPGPFCPPFQVDTVRYLDTSFWREDTSERTIYRYYPTGVTPNGEEAVVYDFSMAIGDTAGYHGSGLFVLSAIDSIQLKNGEYRRRFTFTDVSENMIYDAYYIEGIGGSEGLFGPLEAGGIGVWSYIMCVQEDRMPLYGEECYSFFVDLEDPLSIPQLQISPNPTTDQVLVEYPGREIHAQLWDMTGQVLDQQQGFNQLPVDLRRYPAGVYLLRIFDERNQLLASRKIIHSP